MLSVINSPQIQSSLLWVKIPLGILTGLFLGIILFGLFKTSWMWDAYLADFSEFFTFRPFGIRRMTRVWNTIKDRLEMASEDEYKLAVSAADGLLVDVFRKMNLAGENTEEKLNSLTTAMIPNLEELKQAHERRNTIIHDPDYRLSQDESRRIIDVYEKTFQSLDLI